VKGEGRVRLFEKVAIRDFRNISLVSFTRRLQVASMKQKAKIGFAWGSVANAPEFRVIVCSIASRMPRHESVGLGSEVESLAAFAEIVVEPLENNDVGQAVFLPSLSFKPFGRWGGRAVVVNWSQT